MMSTYPVRNLGGFLVGEWRLARIIDDRRAKMHGRFRGRAVFRPIEGGLACHELGVLRFGAYCDVAEQMHIFRFLSRSRAEVEFRDGRPFHALDLSSGDWAAAHLCADDRYDGRFRARARDVWEVRWTVAGPRKNLTIVSRFRRRAASAPGAS